MSKPFFIVLEGCDNSGKTTLAKHIAAKFSAVQYREPNFSSAEADRLNFECSNSSQREARFLEDRLLSQGKYADALKSGNNVVLDRYIWTGMAYCRAFTPDIYDVYKDIYTFTKNLFIKPDLYIYVSVPVETLYERRDNDKITVDKLRTIDGSYKNTMPLATYGSKVRIIENTGSLEELYAKADLLMSEVFNV